MKNPTLKATLFLEEEEEEESIKISFDGTPYEFAAILTKAMSDPAYRYGVLLAAKRHIVKHCPNAEQLFAPFLMEADKAIPNPESQLVQCLESMPTETLIA